MSKSDNQSNEDRYISTRKEKWASRRGDSASVCCGVPANDRGEYFLCPKCGEWCEVE